MKLPIDKYLPPTIDDITVAVPGEHTEEVVAWLHLMGCHLQDGSTWRGPDNTMIGYWGDGHVLKLWRNDIVQSLENFHEHNRQTD